MNPPIDQLGQENDRLRELLRELIEAGEDLLNHTLGMYASGGDSVEAIAKTRAAIAKAKGEAPNVS